MINTSNLMESFFTREKANEGVEFPLYLPTGEITEHSLKVLGVDSDTFRDMDNQCKREIATSKESSPEEISKLYRELKLKLVACLVVSWTFDKPCTLENVMDFLRNAPQIADAIDKVASKRSLFFAQESKSSSNTPVVTSGSEKSQRAPSKRSVKASTKSTKQRV